VLLKAAAGGGGKGMRVVRSDAELASLLAQARGEARSAFGDDRVFLEKFVERPRHIEVQILADQHGHCIHLGERECSIQRRHQKLIEECPSAVVDAATRSRIGALAVRAAEACAYTSAGTVEFLRGDDGSFYFMEVNARLQVEHPVTEMVTGLDLVKAQIRIAAGEELPLRQADVVLRGHAIECRIIAEDPTRNFMPAPGTLRSLRVPTGPGVRYDGGTYSGCTVPVHYDALLSKLVTWGQDRQEAIDRMARALEEYRIEGLNTSIPFHRKVMRHPAFVAGDLSTAFLNEHPELLGAEPDPWLEEIALVAAAVARFRSIERDSARGDAGAPKPRSGWKWADRGTWR
jgi:acetyl-CoA carboxylase biotin carboxylase subunit